MKRQLQLTIKDCLDRVLIVDDNKDEVKEMMDLFQKNDIAFDYFDEEEIESKRFKKNRQLLFIDLFLKRKDDGNPVGAISTLRSILSTVLDESFGPYGLILWTKHDEYRKDVIEKLSNDRRDGKAYTPAFVIFLSKNKYLEYGYEDLWDDMDKILSKDETASKFMLSWCETINKGKLRAISEIYSRNQDYEKQNETILRLLYLLAKNHTGIPDKDIDSYPYLSFDAYKAFDELLYSDLIGAQNSVPELFGKKPNMEFQTIEDELREYAFLNTKNLIEFTNIAQKQVIPGNVYKTDSLPKECTIPDLPKKRLCTIAVELTPPCDYAQRKKKKSRLILGCILTCPTEEEKLTDFIYSYKGAYNYTIWPIYFENKMSFIYFDFRHLINLPDCDLMDAEKYPVIFRLKNNLFADILQKFSSHASRLGVNSLAPTIKDNLRK